MLSDSISWLDWVSFLFTVVTFFIALRMDIRQARHIKDIKDKEEEIKRKLDEENRQEI